MCQYRRVIMLPERSSSLLKSSTHLRWFCRRAMSDNKVKERQAQLMARGLPHRKPINGVKHVVAVVSGKGGVGKSTTAVNLAVALKNVRPDKEVGILDTDVFGPSVPLMMNLRDTPLLTDDNLMVPLVNYGVKCMSMGFLIEERSPVIWRGLMVMSALDKLLRQVAWKNVDYLILDTPPGTGDTHLSLVQNVPLSGVLLITTPQLAALQVTERGAVMYQKLQVPIIGIVENMSNIKCDSCGNVLRLFGEGCKDLSVRLGIELLEELPLNGKIPDAADNGTPVVVRHPESDLAATYKNIAEKVLRFLEKNETPSDAG